jgi:hypothetical protein
LEIAGSASPTFGVDPTPVLVDGEPVSQQTIERFVT